MKTTTFPVPVSSSGTLKNNTPQPYDFSIKDLFAEAWQRVKGTKATYLGSGILCCLILQALTILGFVMTYLYAGSLDPALRPVAIGTLSSRVIAFFLAYPLYAGLSLLAVYRSVNQPIKIKRIFSAYRSAGKLFIILFCTYFTTYLIAILSFTGFELVHILGIKTYSIIPIWLQVLQILIGAIGVFITIYIFQCFMFTSLLVLEKRLGVFAAIKASFLGFKQHGFKIMVTIILFLIVYLISLLPLFIGIIWSLPWALNIKGILYRTIYGVEAIRE